MAEDPEKYDVRITVGDATVEVAGAEDGVVRIVEALAGVLRAGGGTPRAASDDTPQRQANLADPRSLFAAKNPKTQNEGVVVAAFYLRELAPPETRTETIDRTKVENVFRQAKFKLPKDLAAVLINTQKAGYLDKTGTGEYRLNPVGWNLVEHSLGSE
ncbi:MAG: hypothetical protein WD184_11185 [Acidimicrobiia bacterium]